MNDAKIKHLPLPVNSFLSSADFKLGGAKPMALCPSRRVLGARLRLTGCAIAVFTHTARILDGRRVLFDNFLDVCMACIEGFPTKFARRRATFPPSTIL